MRVYNRHTHQNDTHDIKVYYSMYHYDSEEEVTVPLRWGNNESPSKNPDIKTPLVAKNEWQFPAENSPLAAFGVRICRRTHIISYFQWDLTLWLRLEVMFEDGGRLVNEFFNFRINDIPDEIFNTPELTPCKVWIRLWKFEAGNLILDNEYSKDTRHELIISRKNGNNWSYRT